MKKIQGAMGLPHDFLLKGTCFFMANSLQIGPVCGYVIDCKNRAVIQRIAGWLREKIFLLFI